MLQSLRRLGTRQTQPQSTDSARGGDAPFGRAGGGTVLRLQSVPDDSAFPDDRTDSEQGDTPEMGSPHAVAMRTGLPPSNPAVPYGAGTGLLSLDAGGDTPEGDSARFGAGSSGGASGSGSHSASDHLHRAGGGNSGRSANGQSTYTDRMPSGFQSPGAARSFISGLDDSASIIPRSVATGRTTGTALSAATSITPSRDGLWRVGDFQGASTPEDVTGVVQVQALDGEWWLVVQKLSFNFSVPRQLMKGWLHLYLCPRKNPRRDVDLAKCVHIPWPDSPTMSIDLVGDGGDGADDAARNVAEGKYGIPVDVRIPLYDVFEPGADGLAGGRKELPATVAADLGIEPEGEAVEEGALVPLTTSLNPRQAAIAAAAGFKLVDPRRYVTLIICKPGTYKKKPLGVTSDDDGTDAGSDGGRTATSAHTNGVQTEVYAFAPLVDVSGEGGAGTTLDRLRRDSMAMATLAAEGASNDSKLAGKSYADLDIVARDAFATLGKTKATGSLTFSDFKVVLLTLGVQFTEARAFAWFEQADEDGSGVIEFDEFQHLLYLVSLCDPAPILTIRDAFFMFDTRTPRHNEEAAGKQPIEILGLADQHMLSSILTAMGIRTTRKQLTKIFAAAEKEWKRKMLGYEQVKEIWLSLCDCRKELQKRHISATKLVAEGKISNTTHAALRAYLAMVVDEEDDATVDNIKNATIKANAERQLLVKEKEIKRAAKLTVRERDDKQVKRAKALMDREERLREMREREALEERRLMEEALKEQLAAAEATRADREAGLIRAEVHAGVAEETAKRTRLGLDRIDLSGRGLTSLPKLLWGTAAARQRLVDLIILDISHNALTHLPGLSLLFSLASLQKLDARDNKLMTLPEEIGELRQLALLYLQNNMLRSLPSDIGALKTLQRCFLESNTLEVLPPSICDCAALQVLSVHSNKLVALPETIGKLTALQELDVAGNEIAWLPEGLADCINLQRLDVRDNHLRSLPQRLGALTRLTHLLVAANRLRALPDSIGGCKRLRIIDAARCKLRHLPASLGQCRKLLSLDASQNIIVEIPDGAFRGLRLLQALDVSNNKLASLPATIGRLAELQTANLSCNRLRTLPPDIAACLVLRHLDVHMNALGAGAGALSAADAESTASILPATMGTMQSLEWLDVSFNGAKYIAGDIAACQNLLHLNLSNNRLVALDGPLLRIPSLLTLDASTNDIASVHGDIRYMTSLRALDLSVNRITRLPDSLGELPNLRHLHLYNNRLATLPFSMAWMFPQLVSFDAGRNPFSSLPNKWASHEVVGAADTLGLRFVRSRREPLMIEIRRTRAREILRRMQGLAAAHEDRLDWERMSMLAEDTRLHRKGSSLVAAEIAQFSSRHGWSRQKPGAEKDSLHEWLAYIRHELEADARIAEGLRAAAMHSGIL